jgi:anamorsin
MVVSTRTQVVAAAADADWAALVARAKQEQQEGRAEVEVVVPADIAARFPAHEGAMAAALAGLLVGGEGVVASGDGGLSVVLERPAFEAGAAQKLPAATGNRVVLDLGDDDDGLGLGIGGGAGLVDEDALLEDEDKVRPDGADDDCETSTDGARKACKNCTCGRAEEEEAGTAPEVKTVAQASACGNCYLGDAFRCASCPSRGKPAFKPGQENVELELTDDI